MEDVLKVKFSRRTIAIILLVIALLSNIVVSKIVSNPSINASTLESLDKKKVTVVKLAGAAAASSTALTLIPGDTAMPIANELAELSKYFIIVLSAILLEKMLIAVVGYISFSYIIPFACILGIIYLFTNYNMLKNIGIKLAIFALVIYLAIPISIKISDLIYDSYEASIEQTVVIANENNKYIEEQTEEFTEEEKSLLEKIGDSFSTITSKIGSGVSDIIKKGEDSLSAFLDSIAVLIVTTCVIPIIVILIFVWILKNLFNYEINFHKK